jgi:hypothetical protein
MNMAVKFKVGFTMSAETLFGIIAKFLPVEDLQVEEVMARVERPAKVARLAAPTSPPRKRGNRHSGASLDHGANAIILKFLADGKAHAAGPLRPLFTAGGYAASGVGSRLSKLRDAGVVFQPDIGLWQLQEAHLRKTG